MAGSYEHDHRHDQLRHRPHRRVIRRTASSSFSPTIRRRGTANGEHWRLSPQAYYYYGPLSLLGEYVISDQQVRRTTGDATSADLQNTAWEISGGWVLTGEEASSMASRRCIRLIRTTANGARCNWSRVMRSWTWTTTRFRRFANPADVGLRRQSLVGGLELVSQQKHPRQPSFSHTTFTDGCARHDRSGHRRAPAGKCVVHAHPTGILTKSKI